MLQKQGKPRRAQSKRKKTKKFQFRMLSPEAQNVSIAGDFNNWDETSHPLKKDSKGVWKASINLVPGRYEYRFLVDGDWQNDPHCNNFVRNPYGGENCVFRLDEK